MTRQTQPEPCAPEHVTFELNGDVISQWVSPATTLLDILRGSGRITSARAGCRIGRCGACTVLLNGQAVPGCRVMAWQVSGCTVETAEGLAEASSKISGQTVQPFCTSLDITQPLPTHFTTNVQIPKQLQTKIKKMQNK